MQEQQDCSHGGAVFQKFLNALQGTNTEQSRVKGAAFKPKAGDVIIATPPKSGTTMVQQV
jgi:hypothetical protein